jgi:hypothetical protein
VFAYYAGSSAWVLERFASLREQVLLIHYSFAVEVPDVLHEHEHVVFHNAEVLTKNYRAVNNESSTLISARQNRVTSAKTLNNQSMYRFVGDKFECRY